MKYLRPYGIDEDRTDLVQEIGKKLQITVTIIIFLILVIKTFFEKYLPGNQAEIHLAFSGLVALYILCLGAFWSTKKEHIATHKNLHIINLLLNINLFLTGFVIILFGSIEELNKLPEGIKPVAGIIITLLAVVILLIPIFILCALGGMFSTQFRFERRR